MEVCHHLFNSLLTLCRNCLYSVCSSGWFVSQLYSAQFRVSRTNCRFNLRSRRYAGVRCLCSRHCRCGWKRRCWFILLEEFSSYSSSDLIVGAPLAGVSGKAFLLQLSSTGAPIAVTQIKDVSPFFFGRHLTTTLFGSNRVLLAPGFVLF